MQAEDFTPAAPADAGSGALSTPDQVTQLGDQLTAIADALHERTLRELRAYGGGPVPGPAQQAARQLLDDEQVLRQRANALYLQAATLIVKALPQSQLHVMQLTAAAAEQLKQLVQLRDAMGVIGRVLELSGAALTGNPVLIMRALEDMHHMIDAIELHNPKPAAPAPSVAPEHGSSASPPPLP
ncbi:hypothetical protein GCM10027321_45530 [Massilia terrae]|uniref:Chemotaxis protein n=1 Tax=Massilia terrae TaxID=1811224 RepID=A0ABT2D1U1_9BURK|nr:hypothetical protein [Massilia terrae]MCS0660204.1 hypothetical protein [Massilia terrae]